jgi:hypothetical protein
MGIEAFLRRYLRTTRKLFAAAFGLWSASPAKAILTE